MTIGNPSVTLKNPYLMGSELYYLKIGKYGPINSANFFISNDSESTEDIIKIFNNFYNIALWSLHVPKGPELLIQAA